MVNIIIVVRFRKPVKKQKVKKLKVVEIYREKKWGIKRILNKRIVCGYVKYLVHWKGCIVKHGT